MPKKVAKDNDEEVEKDLDYGPYDKDESEEEEAGQNVTPKAAKTTTKSKNSTQKAAEKAAAKERMEVLRAKGAADLLSPEEQKEFC